MQFRNLALSVSVFTTTALTEVAFAQEPPAQKQPPTRDEMLAWLKESLPFSIHGGVLMWHYQPLDLSHTDPNSEIYYANLLFDTKFDDRFGYHFEPRFRDTKLRPFFESNIWIQENYLSFRPCGEDGGVLKAGKIYTQFGRFWDGVFYGNIPYFDGLKLDPDIGLSWEQRVKASETVAVDWSAQFFAQDGATNGSLQNRDTLSVGTQRNIGVVRVAPTFEFSEKTSATVGVSAMRFEADLPAPTNDGNVTRLNAEAALTVGPFTVFGDYTHQQGDHVVDFPVVGSNSRDIDYLMSGLSYQKGDFTLRYSYSYADYSDVDVKEDLHLPRVEYKVNSHLSIWLEYVYWNRDTDGHNTIQDRSLNLILYGSF
ncbi:MAG TPA: hypothetical protein VK843_13060 [Planctomycetota bacterium]|nr:hypothetical protein [Planctomycetota bacterium]